MKNTFFPVLIIIVCGISQSSLAAIPTMYLTWTASDPVGVAEFRLYFSHQPGMADKTQHQQCSTPVENSPGHFTMTCTDIPLEFFPAYIQVSALYQDGTEVSSNIQPIATDPGEGQRPSVVRGFTVVREIQVSETTVFYWSMDHLPQSSILSDAGNITITTYQQPASSVTGVIGNALHQTGTWQAYQLPMAGFFPSSRGTITFLARHDYPPDSSDATTRFFFTSSDREQANSIYAYTYKNNIYFYLYDRNRALHRTFRTEDTWQPDTWYRYSFSWDADAGSLVIHRDEEVVSRLESSPWSESTPDWGDQSFYIGYNHPLGSLDEFYIHNE